MTASATTFDTAGHHAPFESFLANDLRVALLAQSYVPRLDMDEFWRDVRAHEIEAPGYVAGGKSLTGKSISPVGSTKVLRFTAAPLTWPNASIGARFAILYDRTPPTDATRPLIAFFDFGKVMHSDNGNWTITWHPNGILERGW